MVFNDIEVIELVKNPKQADEVIRGRKYESRLRLFTEPKFKEEIKDESAWEEFRKFMRIAISEEKDIRISEFIQYPLSSVNITESLMNDLYKVFDAGDSYFSVNTVKKSGGDKVQKVLSKININGWIEKEGKKILKNSPNTIVVVDKDDNGDAYLLSIDNDRVVDVVLKDGGVECEYVTFLHSISKGEDGIEEKRYAMYDDENYNVVLVRGSVYSLEKTVKHGSNSCPARMFLEEGLNYKSKFSRKSPLATPLSKLQEWQLFDIYKFYTDHYAPFPVLEMTRAKCGNDNCVKGTINTEQTYYAGGETKTRTIQEKCKTCSSRNSIGVGSKIMLDPVEDGEKGSAGIFRMISNDVENLEYLKDKLDSIEDYIKMKVVGVDNSVTKEAVNEKQVVGSFESRTNVLLGLKSNLDELYVWIAKTIGKLTIGDKPLDVNANFGTEWYLVSESDLQERFKVAKEIGLPESEIDLIYCQIIETKYKGNPDRISRLKLINELNPCPYDSLEDKIKKVEVDVISKVELIISERITIFVKMFELSEGNILEFGEDLSDLDRVDKILIKFKNYANVKESESNE